MSYLAQVIATAGEAEIVELKSKIAETERKIKSLDKEVKDYLESNYMKFTVLLQENHLIFRAKDLSAEIGRLENRINSQVKRELDTCAEDVKILISKLQEIDLCLEIVNQLLQIDEMIRTAEEDQNHGRYLEAAKKFKSLKEMLAANEHFKHLKVYDSLSHHVSSRHDKFLNDSSVVWNQFITWNEVQLPSPAKRLTLTVNNVDGKSDVIRVLMYYDYLDYEVRLLSNKLFACVLEPIIKYNALVNVETDDGPWTISLDYKEEPVVINSKICLHVIENLYRVFNALLESLDAFISEEETFVSKVGELLETSFCDCFMEHCLYKAIPTKKDELDEFVEVAEKITEFDQFLKDNGFMKPSNTLMLDCVKNVNNLFISKTCQTYLATARKIFDEDLHDMVRVSSPKEKRSSRSSMDDSDLALCRSALQRPTCCISKSTQDLLQLILTALKEIPKSEDRGIELFYTIRDIISLYCDLMPLKHNILLKSIPQQSALFYNNCMYFAHELVSLGIGCQSLLPENVNATFVDFIEPLKSLGHSVLNSQVQTQQEQILKIVADSGLSGLSNLDEYTQFPVSIEKSLRQCLRQLTLLQSVWQNVLPQNIYCKTIGLLCNCFVEKLIDSVLQLQDISENTATQLTNVFTIVLSKTPDLFPDSKEVFRHIKRWSKFGELLIVLNGSLKDIDDRWADGKGPLAQEFQADHVKHLIRALFQPSDRRSALLSRIR